MHQRFFRKCYRHFECGIDRSREKSRHRSLARSFARVLPSTFSPHFLSINVKCNRLDAHYGSARQLARTSNRFFRSRIMPRSCTIWQFSFLFPLSLDRSYIYFNTHIPRRWTAGKDSNVFIPGSHHEHFNCGEMTGKIVQRGVLRENGAAVCAHVCLHVVCVRAVYAIFHVKHENCGSPQFESKSHAFHRALMALGYVAQ